MDVYEFVKLVRSFILDIGDEAATEKKKMKILKAIEQWEKAGYLS